MEEVPEEEIDKPCNDVSNPRNDAKTSNGASLNDGLRIGPTFQPDLLSHLIRF